MLGVRRIDPAGTGLARAQCSTIRLKLFKIGATILCSVRRIHVLLVSACPYRELFLTAAVRLRPNG